ncbi:MAG: asparagine synthase-related protein [Pseudomonadota bacterium]
MAILFGCVSEAPMRLTREDVLKILRRPVAPGLTVENTYLADRGSFALRDQDNGSGLFSNEAVTVIADARLDDICALAEKLSVSKKSPDKAELIAMSYLKWGRTFVEHLKGDFAVVIWDRRTHSLLCARDRFGRVPICYKMGSGHITLATDYDMLVGQGEAPNSINKSWVAAYVSGLVLDESQTPYQNVFRLAPGSVLYWTASGFSIEKYWSYDEVGPTFERVDPAEIRNCLDTAVARRVDSDPTKTAALLSGGLDSSSICAIANTLRTSKEQTPLSTLSLVFDESLGEDEREYIRALHQSGTYNPIWAHVPRFSQVDAMKRLIRGQGQPFIGTGATIFEHALVAAQEHGFSTLLDGHGGDETVSMYGTSRLTELAEAGKWMSLARDVRQYSKGTSDNWLRFFINMYAVKGKGRVAAISRRLRARLPKSTNDYPTETILAKDWQNDQAIAARKEQQRSALPQLHSSVRSYQEAVLRDPMQSYAFEHLSRLYRTRGLKPEFPFWDQDLVELCLRTPSHQHMDRGETRLIIRSAMQNSLPRKILDRPDKFNFGNHLARAMADDRDALMAYCDARDLMLWEFVDRDVYKSATMALDHSNPSLRAWAITNVWFATSLAIWLEQLSETDHQTIDTSQV